MTLKYHLGCSGWSYEGWKGHFYPADLDNRYWLSYYSQIFDFVELDSTFYRIPSLFMVNNWNKRTPDNFRFAVKFPKSITHDKRLKNLDNKGESYEDIIWRLIKSNELKKRVIVTVTIPSLAISF